MNDQIIFEEARSHLQLQEYFMWAVGTRVQEICEAEEIDTDNIEAVLIGFVSSNTNAHIILRLKSENLFLESERKEEWVKVKEKFTTKFIRGREAYGVALVVVEGIRKLLARKD